MDVSVAELTDGHARLLQCLHCVSECVMYVMSVPAACRHTACSEVINGCWPEPLGWPLNKHYTSLRLMMMTMMQSKAHLPPRFQHLIKHARNDTVSLEVESERLRKMKCYSSNFFKSYNHEIFFTLPALKTVFSNSDVSFVRYIIYLVLDLLGSCPSTFPRLHLLTLFIHMTRQSILSHGLHKRLQAVSSLTRIWCMDILDISTSACCCWAWSLTFDLWHKRLSISMQQTAAAAIAVCAHVNCLRLISVTCETVCSCISIQRQHVCAPVSRILIPLYNAAYVSDTLYMRPLTSGSPSQARTCPSVKQDFSK